MTSEREPTYITASEVMSNLKAYLLSSEIKGFNEPNLEKLLGKIGNDKGCEFFALLSHLFAKRCRLLPKSAKASDASRCDTPIGKKRQKKNTSQESLTKELSLKSERVSNNDFEYEEVKRRASERSNKISARGREIGSLPDVVDMQRKKSCERNLRLFLETYFGRAGDEGGKFYLGWSEDHLTVIGKLEDAILNGSLFALAMPRGSGKTTLITASAIWALLYGHRRFVAIVGDGGSAVKEIMADVKTELENNDLLADDFPEICFPIRKLEGIVNRSRGQMCEGVRTSMTWAEDKMILPTTKDNVKSSGSIITCTGITGRIRGMKHTTQTGEALRPDLVLIDDPQNNESAASPGQNKKRLSILNGAVLGLAGPGKKIAGLMACTVIAKNDMADQILNRDLNPAWQGERIAMLKSFPTNRDLWNKYGELRIDSLRKHGDIRDATKFYEDNRELMDAGAEVYWQDRYVKGEISGIQHAMNLYLHNSEAFSSEYQNQPYVSDEEDTDRLRIEHIFRKINNRPKFEIPSEADNLVAYIDVQKTVLYYAVMAMSDDMSGHLVTYGSFPDQRRRYYRLSDCRETFSVHYPNMGLEAQIYSALTDCVAMLCQRHWLRDDGVEMNIDKIMIDSAWGKSTDIVFKYCKESSFASVVVPSRGMSIGPTSAPITDYQKKPGEKLGDNWIFRKGNRALRHMSYDTYHWKTFVRDRVLTAKGERGTWTVYGDAKDIEQHRMLAEQMTSEYSVQVEGRGRKVDVWKLLLHRDNHFWDCVVGCYVASSFLGCKLDISGEETKNKPSPQQRLAKRERRVFGPSGRSF